MRYRLTLLLAGLMFVMTMPATAIENEKLFSHYQKLLEKNLTEQVTEEGGLVTAFDYQAALQDPSIGNLLDKQRQRLAAVDLTKLEGRDESIAFWLNAYNFSMIEHILSDRPNSELVSSVWDYGGRVNPFRKHIFERPLFTIGGEDYSLDQMEKDILLGEDYAQRGWKDARVHFAVNCASVGCPPLRSAVYTAENLEDLLAENTRRALNTDYHLKAEGDKLYVTELFKWYEKDFEEAAGSVQQFIRESADPSVAERAANTSEIGFIDYDWALNKPSNFPELR